MSVLRRVSADPAEQAQWAQIPPPCDQEAMMIMTQ